MKIKSKQLEPNLGSESSPFTSVHSSDFTGSLTGPIRFKVKNETGLAVAKGVPVYINGVSGDVPTIALADSDTTNMPCVGLTESAANNNAEVYIVSFGNLTGLNTAALGTGIVGDTVYISTTAGALTLTPPTGSSSKLQNIGQVIREHATEGIIKVGGAGRTAATPNLDQGKIFIGNASNQSSTSVYTIPIADGTNGQVLTTDGSGAVTFQDASGGGGGISNVVEDTTPQLGGTLDLNSKTIQGHFTPSVNNTYKLGTTSAQWADLYLGDGGIIYFGNDSDTMLYHQNDTGLRLALSNSSEGTSEPKFELITNNNTSGAGPTLILNHQGSDANNDITGSIHFKGDTSSTNGIYSYITSTIVERDNATHAAKLSFYVKSKATYRTAIEVVGNSSNVTLTTSLIDNVNISDHDGTTGLKLANTLVTSTASELNVIDGDTSATSTTLVDADRVVVNDAGTMKQVALTDVMTYVNANVSSGGGGFAYSRVTSDVSTATISTHYSVDVSSNNVTITLPALSNVTKGQEIRFKLYDQASSYKLIIAPATNEKIDSSTSNYELTIKNQAVTLVASDSSSSHDSWEII